MFQDGGKNGKIKYIIQYQYRQDEEVKEAEKKICPVYGPCTKSIAIRFRLFQSFSSGNMEVEPEACYGRATVQNVDKVMKSVDANRHMSTCFNVQGHMSIISLIRINCNKCLKKKFDIWVPTNIQIKNI